jgi:hypothetical protein
MSIRIFENKKGDFKSNGTGAVNYVLSMKDWKGETRSVAPKILDGNPTVTKSIDRLYCQKFAQPCISGSINFADNEDLTEEQKRKLIEDFKRTFLNNAEDYTNCLFVEHRDKGNLEIHFVINNAVILDNHKVLYYNPFPPMRGKDGKFYGQQTSVTALKDTFCALKNHEYGFKQIAEDPLKSRLTNGEKRARQFSKEDFANLDKTKLDKAMRSLVKDKIVNNRDELLKFLKSNGYNVKISADYISVGIKQEDGTEKFSRFKEGIYKRNNDKSYTAIRAEFKEAKVKPIDVEKLTAKLERLMTARDVFNAKRYKLGEQEKPTYRSKNADQDNDGGDKAAPPKAQQDAEQQKAQQTDAADQKPPQNVSIQADTPFTEQKEDEKSSSESIPGTTSTGQESVSAQMSVDSARSALANAKTWAERIKAEQRLAQAQAYLDRVLGQLEQEKIKQHNRRKL